MLLFRIPFSTILDVHPFFHRFSPTSRTLLVALQLWLLPLPPKVSKHTCMFCDGTGKQKVEQTKGIEEEEEQPAKVRTEVAKTLYITVCPFKLSRHGLVLSNSGSYVPCYCSPFLSRNDWERGLNITWLGYSDGQAKMRLPQA